MRSIITSKNDAIVRKHRKNFQLVREKLVEVEAKDALRNFKNPVTGEVAMEYFDIQPGKEIGELKEYIKNAILDGIIENNFEKFQNTNLDYVLLKNIVMIDNLLNYFVELLGKSPSSKSELNDLNQPFLFQEEDIQTIFIVRRLLTKFSHWNLQNIF